MRNNSVSELTCKACVSVKPYRWNLP